MAFYVRVRMSLVVVRANSLLIRGVAVFDNAHTHDWKPMTVLPCMTSGAGMINKRMYALTTHLNECTVTPHKKDLQKRLCS